MNITILTSTELKKHLQTNTICYNHHNTSAGALLILATDVGIFEAVFVDEQKILPNYQAINNIDLKKLIISGTDFQIKVWKAALEINSGKTLNYENIAKAIGHPKSYRAVANALGQNKIAYFIPCHRVICKNGNVSGYKWGIEKKIDLLKSETIR